MLQETKKLTIPRRYCMKLGQELEKTIDETQHKHKDISRNDSRKMPKRTMSKRNSIAASNF